MNNFLSSAVAQQQHQTIDLSKAFVKNVHYELGSYKPYSAYIEFAFNEGGSAIWTYNNDQMKSFEEDKKALGRFK